MCRSVGLQNSAATFMPLVAWQEGSGLYSHSGVQLFFLSLCRFPMLLFLDQFVLFGVTGRVLLSQLHEYI